MKFKLPSFFPPRIKTPIGRSLKRHSVPTTIHITHAKAGSSWIDAILRKAFGDAVAPRGRTVAAAVGGDLSKFAFPPSQIYSAMFIGKEEFDSHPELAHAQRFVVIRDLRDTLVSYYFSMRYSHPLSESIRKQRDILAELSVEDGLKHCFSVHLPGVAKRQHSWLSSNELLYRYEELLQNDVEMLTELFIDRLHLPIGRDDLAHIVQRNRFEAKFGRKLGSEDVHSHGRQGTPGNWRRYFTPQIAKAFEQRYGKILRDAGYESSPEWVDGFIGSNSPHLL